MDLNEYARRKGNILTRMIAALVHIFQQFLTSAMSVRDWDAFIHVTYRVVKPYRDEATDLARVFYDDNRAAQIPSVAPQDIFKDDHYPEKWFRQQMLPLFEHAQKGFSGDALIEEAVHRVEQTVEDGARRTIIQGVRDDNLPIRGIARFDPKPPTCAFCTMMISRGPVYHTSAKTAGWEHGTDKLEKLILDQDTDKINEMMNKWHPGCTCVAVPIYKYDNYPTQEQENAAFKIYDKARKNVAKDLRQNESKRNTRMILNEMRQLIYSKNAQQDETTLTRNVA